MDKIVFRMSSAGKCPRALSAQLLGMEAGPTPEFVSRAAEEGNWHEARIKQQLMAEEQCIILHEQQEVKLEYPSFNLIGHIEGIIAYNDAGTYLLEIKTMSQYEFDRWMKGGFKAFPNYAAQITCYMEATGLSECLYIVKNRSSGYEDRRVLTESPDKMDRIIDDLTFTANYIKDKELVSADFDPQSIECRRCEYKKLCIPEPKELTSLEKADLESSVEEWRKGKALVEKGNDLIGIAKESLEQHTKATNQVKWSFNKLAIQLVHYNGSVTYPKKKLLKTFTEKQLEPASQVKGAFDQLRITDLEQSKE